MLSYAALTVRPLYISLLETQLLPLEPNALRGPLKAIILCLLPGLEDEGSDDHDQLIQIMTKFRASVRTSSASEMIDVDDDAAQDSFFWQCFFLATITNASRRQGALSYLVRELPKFSNAQNRSKVIDRKSVSDSDVLSTAAKAALDPEPGLLIRCLAAGLTDSQSLIQRGFLDLLVTHLPLHSIVLQDMVPISDLERLVSAAISVVLRRDMSLNRRLWTWLLGPDSKQDHENEDQNPRDVLSPTSDHGSKQAAYFGKYGLRALTNSVLILFSSMSDSPSIRARPFKLCLSLMDRWEVGGLMIPDIFIPALRSAYNFSKSAEKPQMEEVIKSASQFFDGVESSIIWAKFNQLIATGYKKSSSSDEKKSALDLADFIVYRFNIREEEMVTQHIPHSMLYLLIHLRLSIEVKEGSDSGDRLALDILEKLSSLVPARVFSATQDIGASSTSGQSQLKALEVLEQINKFYSDHHGGLDGSPPPFVSQLLGELILRESSNLLIHLLVRKQSEFAIEPIVRVVCSVSLRIPRAKDIFNELGIFDGLISLLQDPQSRPFRAVAAIISLLIAAQSGSTADSFANPAELHELQNLIVEQIWNHLSPFNPKHHVEAVRCLWQLESVSSQSKAIEAAITTFMIRDLEQTSTSAMAARRFGVLWTHSSLDKTLPAEKSQRGLVRRTSSSLLLNSSVIPSDPSNILSRPILVLLGHLTDEGTELSGYLKAWLQDLPTISRIFVMLITAIKSLHCMQDIPEQSQAQASRSTPRSPLSYANQSLFYMKLLLAILRHASDNIWMTLAAETFSQGEGKKKESQSTVSLQVAIVQLSLQCLDLRGTEPFPYYIKDLHRVALDMILALLHSPYSAPLKELELQVDLLQRVLTHVDSIDPLLQPLLLESTSAALKLQFAPEVQRPLSPNVPRKGSKDLVSLPPSVATSKERLSKDGGRMDTVLPKNLLIDCLKAGFQSRNSRAVLDSWVLFLIEVLPIFEDTIFQNLIPLVECICAEVTLVFNQLRAVFRPDRSSDVISPEPTLITLLNALENVLASGHQRLLADEGKTPNPKSPDQPQGFFGNMVQGVFTADAQGNRKSVGNNRLTVLLCLQDAVRTCFAIWRWGIYAEKTEKHDTLAVASYGYTALRMRHRSRRLLEHLFAAEGLECLETLANMWCQPHGDDFEPQSILGLLNVLNGSKPKHTIPAIFNAIYSRTNPGSLELSQQSSLTSELKDTDLVAFLVDYTKTLDDDSMDEIWRDCAAFLKDVLANPLPHNQILPSLLVFIGILAEKVDNTNFGEQRRTRKELGVSQLNLNRVISILKLFRICFQDY